jgi:hypothetical protein
MRILVCRLSTSRGFYSELFVKRYTVYLAPHIHKWPIEKVTVISDDYMWAELLNMRHETPVGRIEV